AVWDGRSLDLYGEVLCFFERLPLPFPPGDLTAAVLLPGREATRTGGPVLDSSATTPEPARTLTGSILLIAGEAVWAQSPGWTGRHQSGLGWEPGPWAGTGPGPAPLSWAMRDPAHVELAGLRPGGAVCWSLLLFGDGMLHNLATHVTGEADYRAVT